MIPLHGRTASPHISTAVYGALVIQLSAADRPQNQYATRPQLILDNTLLGTFSEHEKEDRRSEDKMNQTPGEGI